MALINGMVQDQGFSLVQGNYSVGEFAVNVATGQDTMVVYDGDALASAMQTGIVLGGVTPGQLNAYWDSNIISYIQIP